MRGLAASFEHVSSLDARDCLAGLLQETAGCPAGLQNESGMWPTLLHRPGADSPEESSGTAMLAAAFFKGMRLGVLDCDEFVCPAARAARALCESFLGPDGRICGVCKGPGPLRDEALCSSGAESDLHRHGAFAFVGLAVEARRFFNAPKNPGEPMFYESSPQPGHENPRTPPFRPACHARSRRDRRSWRRNLQDHGKILL